MLTYQEGKPERWPELLHWLQPLQDPTVVFPPWFSTALTVSCAKNERFKGEGRKWKLRAYGSSFASMKKEATELG